jgi:hypothetical protein
MRTKKEIKEFIDSLGLTEEQFESEGYFHDTILFNADWSRLINAGWFIGYGDSFAYKGNGVVVSGMSGAGKSYLVDLFVKREGAIKLANDEILIMDNGEGVKIYPTMPFKEYGTETLEQAKDSFAEHLASSQGYPIAALLYLELFATNRPQSSYYEPALSLMGMPKDRLDQGPRLLVGLERFLKTGRLSPESKEVYKICKTKLDGLI